MTLALQLGRGCSILAAPAPERRAIPLTHVPASTPSVAPVLVRWLFLLLLAFDLASSPFHAHLHDVAAHDPLGPALMQQAASRLDAGDCGSRRGPLAGHSLTAIRTVQAEIAGPPDDAGWGPLFVAWVRPLLPDPAEPVPAPAWQASTGQLPLPRGAYLRPDGRAPPTFLHA